MREWMRILIVIVVVVFYNFINGPLFNIRGDLSFLNVVITLVLAMIVYTGLEFLFKRKHRDY